VNGTLPSVNPGEEEEKKRRESAKDLWSQRYSCTG